MRSQRTMMNAYLKKNDVVHRGSGVNNRNNDTITWYYSWYYQTIMKIYQAISAGKSLSN